MKSMVFDPIRGFFFLYMGLKPMDMVDSLRKTTKNRTLTITKAKHLYSNDN